MSHSEADLKALTVVKLKELLAARSLPVTGKKDELIARLLAHPDAPLTADTTGPTSAVDEPDGTGLAATAEATAASTTETPRSAGETTQALAAGSADAEDAAPATGGEDAAAAAKEDEAAQLAAAREAARLEEEKRAARLARFGGAPAVDESEEEKKKRAERFGLEQQQGASGAGDDKLNKSLAALDAPLGSQKRQREPKVPKQTSKTAPVGEKGVVGAAAATKGGVSAAATAAEPAAAVAADPELKKRVEEEEEKKRKRLERFGPPAGGEAPQEKKAKVDA
ncbi:hypothetical protein JCM10450v2_005140 [Rhodotorula kratochvilovae]